MRNPSAQRSAFLCRFLSFLVNMNSSIVINAAKSIRILEKESRVSISLGVLHKLIEAARRPISDA